MVNLPRRDAYGRGPGWITSKVGVGHGWDDAGTGADRARSGPNGLSRMEEGDWRVETKGGVGGNGLKSWGLDIGDWRVLGYW